MTRSDVLVIGSGISALTSALLLARKGKSVTVLEQYTKPGGYMHSFNRFGETFDTGAHYVGSLSEGQPFRVLLEYLGIFDENSFSPLNPEGFDVFHFPDGRIQFPQGYENLISELSATFPGHRPAIEKYFAMIRKTVTYFPTYHFADVAEMSIPPEALDMSLKQVVESITDHKPLQSVFYAYCNLHGVFPEDVAFGFHAIVTDSLIEGPYGLNGGGDALTKRFVDAIKALGGQVLLKHKVASIQVENRLATKVVCENGAEFSAEWVISSAHPKATFRLLSDQSSLPPVFKERLKNLKESMGIFGLYATCQQRPSTDPARNYYFFKSTDPQAMFQPNAPGEVPSVVFMSSPKRHWGPEEKNFPISMHAPAPYEWFAKFENETYGRRSPEYKAFKEQIVKSTFAAIDRFEPGFSSNIAKSLSSTPLTHLHFNGSEEGSSYGLYHSIQNTGARAFGPRTKVLNLMLTGQNCLFPGLLGAATSALRTCGHVVGIKPILQELKAMR